MPELNLPQALAAIGPALAVGGDDARDFYRLLRQGVASSPDRPLAWLARAHAQWVRLTTDDAEIWVLVGLTGFDDWRAEDTERRLYGEIATLAEQAAAAREAQREVFELGWHQLGIDPNGSGLVVQLGSAADFGAQATTRPAAASRPAPIPQGLPPASPRPARPGPTAPPPSPTLPRPAPSGPGPAARRWCIG